MNYIIGYHHFDSLFLIKVIFKLILIDYLKYDFIDANILLENLFLFNYGKSA